MARDFVAASSQYLSAASHADFGFTTALSVFYRVLDEGAALSGIVGKWPSGSEDWLAHNEDGYRVFDIRSGGSTTQGYLSTYSGEEAILWVYDGSLSGNANRLKLYVNGVQQTLEGFSGTIPASLASTSVAVEIGRAVIAGTNYFDGKLAEVALWPVALNAGQADQLGRASVSPSLVWRGASYWPLIGRVDPETDLWGGHHATVNGATQAAHVRVYQPAGQSVAWDTVTAAAFKAAWARNANTLLQSGVRP